ncbi:hypothetical protein ACM61V_01845 [Sphingomonas sp. TX0543]|uniref:hypothetical protein n=1 Tax=unclassified Sphingomonas TaxID=196159 RepID=UPI0010F5A934|nr:hypothetical protein [Sphingomonas sp. 3P27F8]
MIAAALLLLAGAAEGRATIGVYQSWGAFRDAAPARCFAIAAPMRAGAASRWRPFASVVSRFGTERRGALFVRLSAAARPGATVTLAVGDRRFNLSARDSAAWSPDAATDRAVIAAMRGGRSMSVSTIAASGRPFADTYGLSGAATAIDAAALGCAGR